MLPPDSIVMNETLTPRESQIFWEGYLQCASEGWNLAKYYRIRPPAGMMNKSSDWIAGYLHGLEHAYIVSGGE